jgi:pimeloyl-ACP methyl ester carboxylesterase
MTPEAGLSLTEHLPAEPTMAVPVVVLVHGSLDRAGSFARVVRRLDDLHTVTYDRRGYHRSRHVVPVHETLAGHVDDLLTVIDGRPSVVVGHSYGGAITLAAASRPEGPGPILAVGAFEPPMPWLGSWATRPRRPGADGAAPDEDPGQVAERFFRRMMGDGAWERLPEATRAARRADGPALVGELAAIRTTEAPFDVTRLAVPAVFGRGTESLPYQQASTDWLVEHTPDARLVEIEGAAHGAHLTHPDGFARFVRAALDRVPRAPR